MVEDDLLIVQISEKHLLLKYLTYSLMFITRDDLHPLLKTLPLPKHNEKVVFADLIKRLHLLKPLLHSYELCRFGVYELADSLATEGVVILYLLADDFRVGDDLHVVVVILVLADHVDEFICC